MLLLFFCLSAVAQAGDTCLHLAARYNHIQCVRVLLNENANISLVNKVPLKTVMLTWRRET